MLTLQSRTGTLSTCKSSFYKTVLAEEHKVGPEADAQPLACYFSDAFQDQKSEPADMRLFVSTARDLNRLAPAQMVRLRVFPRALRDICMDWTHLRDKKKQSGGHTRQERVK